VTVLICLPAARTFFCLIDCHMRTHTDMHTHTTHTHMLHAHHSAWQGMRGAWPRACRMPRCRGAAARWPESAAQDTGHGRQDPVCCLARARQEARATYCLLPSAASRSSTQGAPCCTAPANPNELDGPQDGHQDWDHLPQPRTSNSSLPMPLRWQDSCT